MSRLPAVGCTFALLSTGRETLARLDGYAPTVHTAPSRLRPTTRALTCSLYAARTGLAGVPPHLVAAVIYAVLSVVMVGQGLLPGRTLSGSDSLLSSVPWQSTKPASVPGLGTNFELADSANVFGPMLRYTRSTLPTVPLWNPFISLVAVAR